MTLPDQPLRSHHAQRGFAAIAALFLLVVLAALGATMLALSNTAHLTSVQDVQGSRAYWAARGGLEWAIAGINAATPAGCPGIAAPALLDGFAMVVTCTSQTYNEADATIRLFRLTSVAASADTVVGGLGFVERSVSASLER